MKLLLIFLVLAFALICVQSDPDRVARALSVFGIKLRSNRSERTLGLVVGVLVVLALLVVIIPETPIFLRHNLELCVAILLIPILKGIYRWGPVPGFWPSGVVLKSSASWTGYALLYPAAAVFLGVLFVRCMFFGVWT
jgi:hypothetical protein